MKLVISTPRLLLREFVPGDADALAAVISDPETMRYYPAPFDRPAVEDWIARNRARYETDGFGLWAMVLTSKSQFIGDCGLIHQKVDDEDQIEIGYHVRRDQWGHGFATEAAKACRDYGFKRLGANRLISLIRPENLPSRRVAEKIGMTLWKTVLWRGLEHCVYAIERPA
ncbi:MAG TPA: GNAT family N-acetyltransferase [Terriglobales bacterium]|jgi:RimJ/RimL family protein N-acetyltransferase